MDRIHDAAVSAGRETQSVRLVVVTKAHPVEVALAAVKAGARLLGENYVEEAEGKILSISGEHGVEWHMIGHIQSRKARRVCELFQYVHSLDSLHLANRLDRFAEELAIRMPVLLECNVSGEESKTGFPAWDEHLWADLAQQARQIGELPNLELHGLMTMAPYYDEPERARPFFRKLVRVRDYLSKDLPQVSWSELSMGMSGDFEVAIQEGATIVRVGQAILGHRPG
jgi:hypothetical protein